MIERLYGRAGRQRLADSHVMVVGLGGVGSWTVEALVRTGIGRMTLVDLDEICVSNSNRQLHTLTSTIGQSKAEALAERMAQISPSCDVRAVVAFFTARNADVLLDAGSAVQANVDGAATTVAGAGRPDLVVDAIDSLRSKAVLVAACRERAIPVVVCGGAGGRRDPLALRSGDLSVSGHDGLLRSLRQALRRDHALPALGPWHIPAVWSIEPQVWPTADGCIVSTRPENSAATRLDCADGFGAATMVTGTFGFALAALAVDALLNAAPRPRQA
jgi:tRNA threonylcarbamoyladenosine dehydratase